jgi:hypothetical protein
VSDKLALDVFSDGDGQLALPVEAFRRILRPTGCRLDPMEGFPVVWRYTDSQDGRTGVVLNVPGLLNGGAMSISSRGWLYEAERDGGYAALFLPGSPKRMRLNETRHKVLTPETSRGPLFPPEWPKEAVLRVVRVRFSTIVVLNADYLLSQVPQLPAGPAPPVPAPEPAPAPEAAPDAGGAPTP